MEEGEGEAHSFFFFSLSSQLSRRTRRKRLLRRLLHSPPPPPSFLFFCSRPNFLDELARKRLLCRLLHSPPPPPSFLNLVISLIECINRRIKSKLSLIASSFRFSSLKCLPRKILLKTCISYIARVLQHSLIIFFLTKLSGRSIKKVSHHRRP